MAGQSQAELASINEELKAQIEHWKRKCNRITERNRHSDESQTSLVSENIA